MLLAREFVAYLSRQLVRKLTPTFIETVTPDAVAESISKIITDELMVEDRLNDEVRDLLSQYSEYMRREGVSYQDMFRKIKNTLITQRKVVRAARQLHRVAGIASRFTRGAALSHASVPLGPGHRDLARYRDDPGRHRAALERHARSAAELSGRELPAGPLGDRVSAFLSASIGAAFVGAAFPDLGIETPGGAMPVCYRSTP